MFLVLFFVYAHFKCITMYLFILYHKFGVIHFFFLYIYVKEFNTCIQKECIKFIKS